MKIVLTTKNWQYTLNASFSLFRGWSPSRARKHERMRQAEKPLSDFHSLNHNAFEDSHSIIVNGQCVDCPPREVKNV